MRQALETYYDAILTHFDGKTVGDGGDYSGSMSGTGLGPFTIQVNILQWDNIEYPSINIQPVQNVKAGADLYHQAGGASILWISNKVCVSQITHGAIVMNTIIEEYHTWLNGKMLHYDGHPMYIDSTDITIQPDGELLYYNITTRIRYSW